MSKTTLRDVCPMYMYYVSKLWLDENGYEWLKFVKGDRDMTVESLEVARKVVEKMGEDISGVFEYTHAVTAKKLFSIEHRVNEGATLRSGYCLNVRQVYDGRTKVWSE